LRVSRLDPDAVCAGSSDLYRDEELSPVLSRAPARRRGIVTVGIRAARAGYGYIEWARRSRGRAPARRFVEKPNRQRAGQFLAAGRYLWNSGMFFFRARTMLDAIRTHLPALGSVLDRIGEADAQAEAEIVRGEYPALPDVSIDHGVMEKVKDVAVVPASFGWTDLGSFETAWELAEGKDEAKNSVPERAIVIDASGCFVRAPAGKIVALVGVSDLVVIDTEDALLIVPRDRAQDVKLVAAALKARGDDDHL
jgi:mannose-1-phosphate guanylyltransferase